MQLHHLPNTMVTAAAISIKPNKKQLSTLLSTLLAVGYSFVHISKDFTGIDIKVPVTYSPLCRNSLTADILQDTF